MLRAHTASLTSMRRVAILTHTCAHDPNRVVVAESDDFQLDPGSSTGLDSYIDYVFPTTGTYTIEVGSCCVSSVPSCARYDLHVSLESATFVRSKDIDLIAAGTTWKYWDQGDLANVDWMAADEFDDSQWSAVCTVGLR